MANVKIPPFSWNSLMARSLLRDILCSSSSNVPSKSVTIHKLEKSFFELVIYFHLHDVYTSMVTGEY
ncbi:hypothetical protein [Lederbergia galactosidilytica]|uniref:hypothetical protein n=1 Tax=Lederbergia galactosidilytica TaxID=217031 RepID=UPI001EE62D53|nr:hypothetical protein [Lederbergia galactosidilytica]